MRIDRYASYCERRAIVAWERRDDRAMGWWLKVAAKYFTGPAIDVCHELHKRRPEQQMRLQRRNPTK